MEKKHENMSLQEATIKALYNELDDSDEIRDVEGVVDDVLVITDPEITKDEYEEVIDRAQEIVEDTPEGDIPFDEDYIGQYLQTCPICGSSFVEDHLLEPGATCPICLEQPDAFVVVGKIDSDVAVAEELGISDDEEFDNDNEFELGEESDEELTMEKPVPEVEEEPNENFERSGGRRASNLGRNREVASKEVPQGNKLTEKLEENLEGVNYQKIKSAIEDLDSETQSMIGTDEGVENEYADGYKWATDICLDIVDMCKNTGEDLIDSIESKKSELGTESEEMSDDALAGATQAYDDVIGIVENFLRADNSLNEKKLVEDEDSEFAKYCQLFRKELDDAREYADNDWTFDVEGNSKSIMTLEDMGNLVSKKLANIGFELGLAGYTFTETTDINIAKSELIDIIKNSSTVDDVDNVINEISSITESKENTLDENKVYRYKVSSYYGLNYSGLEDNLETDDYDEARNFVWDKVQNGGAVELVDTETGDRKRFVSKTSEQDEMAIDIEDFEDTKFSNFICNWCGTKFKGQVDNEGRMPNCPHCLEDRYADDEYRLEDGHANKDVHFLNVESGEPIYTDYNGNVITENKEVKTENKIVIDNMGETYTIDTDAKTYTIKTPNGEKTFPFEKMDEFVKGYRGVNRINKPMSVIAYTDYKNGALRNWNVVGGQELAESVVLDDNAVCNIDLSMTRKGKVVGSVKIVIKGIDHTTDKISYAIQTRFAGKLKSDVTGKVYTQDIYVADDLWLEFMYYDESSNTFVFKLDGDTSKDPELVAKQKDVASKEIKKKL